MERARDWAGDCRSSRAALELSRCTSGDVAGHTLADLLEHRRTRLHVDHSFEKGGPDFSRYPAALFVSRCANEAVLE